MGDRCLGLPVGFNNYSASYRISWLKESGVANAEDSTKLGMTWDDTGNKRALLAGQIAATLNGSTIYFVAKVDTFARTAQAPDAKAAIDLGTEPLMCM